MLQTIPDPFDSYGPPQSENQIFSILPPLSVIANASSVPSPLTASTPELESSDGLPSTKNSWSSSGGFFPDTAAAWADVPSSPPAGSGPSSGTTSPARSISPTTVPKAVSSLASINRRHSHPVSSASFTHQSRKSESKLRSVLSVLEEGSSTPRSRQNGDADDGHARSMSADSAVRVPTTNGKAPDLGDVDAGVWRKEHLPGLDIPSHGGGGEDTTPRNTLRATTQSPPIPSFDDPLFAERSRSPNSDDTATITSPGAS